MKRDKKARLLILQNILLHEKRKDVTMGEDDIIDAMYDYVEMLPKDMQRLYKLYYIDMISHIDIGIRYGVSGGAISNRLRIIFNKLSELIKMGLNKE